MLGDGWSKNWNWPGDSSLTFPNELQLVNGVLRLLELNTVKLMPGELVNRNWKAPLEAALSSVNTIGETGTVNA